jgi:hypothetical protein
MGIDRPYKNGVDPGFDVADIQGVHGHLFRERKT